MIDLILFCFQIWIICRNDRCYQSFAETIRIYSHSLVKSLLHWSHPMCSPSNMQQCPLCSTIFWEICVLPRVSFMQHLNLLGKISTSRQKLVKLGFQNDQIDLLSSFLLLISRHFTYRLYFYVIIFNFICMKSSKNYFSWKCLILDVKSFSEMIVNFKIWFHIAIIFQNDGKFRNFRSYFDHFSKWLKSNEIDG